MSRPHLVFETSGGRYAVPADRVRQVLWLPVLAARPESGGGWVGQAHLEDEEVPVLDLDLVFGQRPEPYSVDHRLLDLDAGEDRLGVVAAEVLDVVALEPEGAGEAADGRPVRARVSIEGEATEILAAQQLPEAADAAGPAPISPEELFAGFDEVELEELADRQRHLAAWAQQEPGEPEDRAVLADVGDQTVAIPMAQVRAFVRVGATTPVPSTPDHILGLMNHRGEIVTVVDIAPALGRPPSPEGIPERAALVDMPEGPSAIAVERIGGSAPLPETARDAPAAGRLGIEGTVQRGDRSIPILSPRALLRSERLVVDQGA